MLEQGPTRMHNARMHNARTQEHAAALSEIAEIAGHRFDDLVADVNPSHSARTQRCGASAL